MHFIQREKKSNLTKVQTIHGYQNEQYLLNHTRNSTNFHKLRHILFWKSEGEVQTERIKYKICKSQVLQQNINLKHIHVKQSCQMSASKAFQ